MGPAIPFSSSKDTVSMRHLAIVLTTAALAASADLRPFVLATTGLTLPTIKIEDADEGDFEETMGYSFTIGAGVRAPVNDKLAFEASAGMSFVQGGFEAQDNDTYNGTYYDYNTGTETPYTEVSTLDIEYTVTPQLLDLDAGLLFQATPRVSLGGGLTFSIPTGGRWKGKMSWSRTCTPSTPYCDESDDSDSESGDIEEIEDDADISVKSFASLRFGGEYLVNDRVGVTAGYLLPLGNWLDEDGAEVSWSRLLVGVRYAFGS